MVALDSARIGYAGCRLLGVYRRAGGDNGVRPVDRRIGCPGDTDCGRGASGRRDWWREEIGGILLILVGVAHSVFAYIAAGHRKVYAVVITSVPFLLVGSLFLASWSLSRRRGAARS
jgi:hypothetical protein